MSIGHEKENWIIFWYFLIHLFSSTNAIFIFIVVAITNVVKQ